MPSIDLSILNQRQTPAFYADTLANRPAAGFVGRIFVSTNTFAFYRDNGTSWDLIGGPGTGTVTGSGAVNQVTYWNGTTTIAGDNGLYYDAANDFLGIGTNAPGAAIDVHSTLSIIAQLNQLTPTNNSLLVFQNSNAGLWRIGNYYNAGANDFGVYDIIGAIQPLTIKKTTGQVLIGTSTVGGGKLVVASATADNGVQIVGASAPSLRLDDAVTGATKRAGLGISTATNNFIQGSADRDFCIFNGSTTASPILFGVYNGTNIQEAARISSSRNFIIGSSTDTGQAFQVTGTSKFNSSVSIINNTSLNLQDSGGNAGFSIKNTSSNVAFLQNLNNAELSFQAGFSSNASNIITFKVGAGTEIARFINAGSLLLGITSTFANGRLQIENQTGVQTALALRAQATTLSSIAEFYNPNGQVGSIQTSGTTTAYVTLSDYRLKNDFQNFNGLELIEKIKTYDYEWQTDKSRAHGVIAHELQEIVGYSVFGEKDGESMQGVDYSKLVPILIKAIQELNTKVKNL